MTTVKQTPAILRATPGRILKEEFLDGFNLTQVELSERTGIPRSTINEIIKGKRPINAETALALGIFFGTSAQFWLNLQTQFDIRRVQIEKEPQLRARIRPVAVA
jgi:addiction module HigA family antidote